MSEPSSNGSACKTCGQPNPSDLPLQDRLIRLIKTYFTSPRMWPVGYILESSYSPFFLERDISAVNWRDAFEDLLALESGRPMISESWRKTENEFAARCRFELTSHNISVLNENMRAIEELRKNMKEAHRVSVELNLTQDTKVISSRLLPLVEAKQAEIAAEAQHYKVEFEESKNSPASRVKSGGEWIASLINNGALPGWTWHMVTTARDNALEFNKRDQSVEGGGGVFLSESEIEERIEKGTPYANETPHLLGRLELQAVRKENGPATIVTQKGQSDPIKLPDGSTSSKITLVNRLADGTQVTKEFMPESV